MFTSFKTAVSLAICSKIEVIELTSFGLNQVALVVNSSNSAVTLTAVFLPFNNDCKWTKDGYYFHIVNRSIHGLEVRQKSLFYVFVQFVHFNWICSL